METWERLRKGISVKNLAKNAELGIQFDIIRLEPGLNDVAHIHDGFEWVYILDGSFEDHNGVHKKGDFVENFKDQEHHVKTVEGCEILIVWTGSVTHLKK